MLSFESDYTEGAHEEILRRLCETNYEQLSGYGNDKYCESAKEKIKAATGCADAEVFLLVGGTQTNQIVIDTMLDAYEGVVCADTGHISCHEAGAVEFTGHKVLTLPHEQGKINPDVLQDYLKTFFADDNHNHMVCGEAVVFTHKNASKHFFTSIKQHGALLAKGRLLGVQFDALFTDNLYF